MKPGASDLPAMSPQRPDNLYGNKMAGLEEIQKTFASPRHYLRRKALVESELHDDVTSSVMRSSSVKYFLFFFYV